jgi:ClpP class serine protease
LLSSPRFGTASVCRGLKEAGEDDTIGAVVLRIDSGGGSVVDSDTIGAAVRDLKNKGKTVVASFGNSSASGGYWVSTEADAILAARELFFPLPPSRSRC